MELRDRNGLTEAEFLAQYEPKNYPRPSFTADVAAFAHDEGGNMRLLMVRRGGHPYLGCWALPGGFVNPNEDADAAAARELEEETGVEDLPLEQFGCYSAPGRDPRAWTVSAAYMACLSSEVAAHAGDDAADATWCPLAVNECGNGRYELTIQAGDDQLRCIFEPRSAHILPPRAHVLEAAGFAFDHAQIVADAWLALRRRFGW